MSLSTIAALEYIHVGVLCRFAPSLHYYFSPSVLVGLEQSDYIGVIDLFQDGNLVQVVGELCRAGELA